MELEELVAERVLRTKPFENLNEFELEELIMKKVLELNDPEIWKDPAIKD